jgi:hypothetical protein
MKPGSEKYNKVLNLLRESKPLLDSTDDIEREVVRQIMKINHRRITIAGVFDFLFGWVYIGWVRRCLITASGAMVLVFVFQQIVIIRRIDMLSKQIVVVDKGSLSKQDDEVERILAGYRNFGRRFPSKTARISEIQMKELLESVNELKIRYKEIDDLIEGDPELKKLIEKKLIENNRNNTNL